VLACKLLREENRLYRKERKLLLSENGKLKNENTTAISEMRPTENTLHQGKLLNEMKDHFLT